MDVPIDALDAMTSRTATLEEIAAYAVMFLLLCCYAWTLQRWG